jgi:hypothetical protein
MGRFAGLLIVSGVVAAASAQDAALKDRVAQLVERLGSADASARQTAEEALRALGPKALPLLPAEPPQGADDDQRKRLDGVRDALERAEEAASLEASRITIEGQGIRFTEALRQLQSQSGNRITDLREAYGAEATNPTLDLSIRGRPFFEALDELARKAGVAPMFYTGDGSIGLMPAASAEEAQPSAYAKAGSGPVKLSGPFRVELKSFGAVRDLASGQARANAKMEFAWEPRLRPMLLALRADQLEIVDDRGESVPPDVMEESTSVVLRPENPVAEINLNMTAPDRSARALKKLTLRGDVTVPAGLRRFRFPKLDAANVSQEQGDVKLTLESTEVEDNIWKVRVRLEMPGEGPAFDSYQQGLFNNQLWLERADGSRFDQNGGFSTLSVGPGRLGFEYLFVDAPGKPSDYQFVYETPSRVTTIPVEVTFEDVPLP